MTGSSAPTRRPRVPAGLLLQSAGHHLQQYLRALRAEPRCGTAAAEGGKGITFDFRYSNALPYSRDIAILIADSLKQIGVTATLRPTPALQLLDAVRARINGAEPGMTGMYLSEGVIWLNDPSTLTNLGWRRRRRPRG